MGTQVDRIWKNIKVEKGRFKYSGLYYISCGTMANKLIHFTNVQMFKVCAKATAENKTVEQLVKEWADGLPSPSTSGV